MEDNRLKQKISIIFIALFCIMLSLPLLFTNYKKSVSETENRTLAAFPKLMKDGERNDAWTSEFTDWFGDHLGFRDQLIGTYAKAQFYAFDRTLNYSDLYIGEKGELLGFTKDMILDYQRLDRRTEEELVQLGNSYQNISDWLKEQGIQFYYVQCYDKHSIIEQDRMKKGMHPVVEESKTDQLVRYLQENTDITILPLKQCMLDADESYVTYSKWGDPWHWSQRGGIIAYREIMNMLNQNNQDSIRVLSDDDFNITYTDQGMTISSSLHQVDMEENFVMKERQNYLDQDVDMGTFGSDDRNHVWKNSSAASDKKILIYGDSYMNTYIIDYVAESFQETWGIRLEHITEFDEAIKMAKPDIVILECAERVDCNYLINRFAGKLVQN